MTSYFPNSMIISKEQVIEVGGCNFCDRSYIVEGTSSTISYPYKYVYEVRGKNTVVRYCRQCIMELKLFINKL